MDYSRLISERLWSQPDKGELESNRENEFIDDIVQKHHIERELLAGLDGVHTVFDGGAGSGRFSILLAKRGIRVVHFDISQSMIDKARELADKAGVLQYINFVHGALEDLSAFSDRQFDMVVSFDAPISYTWPNQERVIGELVRIARKRIMISVSSRMGMLPYVANPLQKDQFILNRKSSDGSVQWFLQYAEERVKGFAFNRQACEKIYSSGMYNDGTDEINEYIRGGAPWPITYHFLPDELAGILQRLGVRDVTLAGPGAYARTIPNEILVKIMNDPQQRKDFLEFCHLYDSNPYVCGMGKDNLFAKGELG